MTLSYHVDYWDYLGWKDPFASKDWTARQKSYGKKMYTPMFMIQGQSVNRKDIEKFLGEAPVVALTVKASLKEGKFHIQAGTKKIGDLPDGVKVYAAVAEDKLVTHPKSGENKGAELRESGVVRALLEGKDVGDASWELPMDPAWKSENLRAVVFVQDPQSRRVFEAAQAKP